ncbi:MAG: hypothetical protein AABX86_00445 [Nanoarchaeota archaeon]
MPTSALGNAIQFLHAFGFFDVVLPFLLVFTIVFGILEKTKILGVEGKDKAPKKNLNAMVAFSIAFFVVAATNVVQAIQISLPAISMILLIVVLFMLLLGSIAGEAGEKGFNLWDKDGPYRWAGWLVVVFILLAIITVFLYAFGYFGAVWYFLTYSLSKTVVSTIALLVLVVVALYVVLKGPKKEKGKE